MTPPIEHMYIHIPFCDGKCDYCAFYSTPFDPCLADRFLDALAAEMDAYVAAGSRLVPRTLYIGGGTPSALDRARLTRLLDLLGARLDTGRLREWSVEVNPGGADLPTLDLLARAGVNRISIGAQAFDDATLAAIGRRHSVADTLSAVAAVKAAGIGNWGMDLMAALPRVDAASWRHSLRAALDLSPAHLSVYAFSVESGTRMERRAQTGEFRPPDDKEQLRALDIAARALAKEGFRRYELSNYARTGFECEYNLACWRGEDYLGFGPAAASRAGRERWTNRPDVERYSATLLAGKAPPRSRETLDRNTDIAERLLFGFRLAEGVDLTAFSRRHGASAAMTARWEGVLARLAEDGLTRPAGNRWTPTERGFAFADHVAAELWPMHEPRATPPPDGTAGSGPTIAPPASRFASFNRKPPAPHRATR